MQITTALAPRVAEPWRTVDAVRIALGTWTARQVVAAAAFSLAFAVLIGVPTVLIPNPVFGREIPVVAWNYPVWIATSVLAGMLAATYVRSRRPATAEVALVPATVGGAPAGAVDATDVTGADDAPVDAPSRFAVAGGVLAWFAVGCPVCNKIALLALGYSGALTWFAPMQPYLAAVALLMTAGALVFRLRGQVFCPSPAVRRG
jgi:hypothetical protein